jgi:hypothetical protein
METHSIETSRQRDRLTNAHVQVSRRFADVVEARHRLELALAAHQAAEAELDQAESDLEADLSALRDRCAPSGSHANGNGDQPNGIAFAGDTDGAGELFEDGGEGDGSNRDRAPSGLPDGFSAGPVYDQPTAADKDWKF